MKRIIIKTCTGLLQSDTDSIAIYDYLIEKGYDHDAAQSVVSWAKSAPAGAEYELAGAEIFIND